MGGQKTYLFAFLDDHSRLLPGYRWGYAEDTVRLAAALRPALASRGVPNAAYVDNGSAYVDAWLLRACAKLGVRLVHSTPGRPEGRGKIERFFRTVREQFLVEIAGEPDVVGRHHVTDLAELNRLFAAWVETCYHRTVHSETGQTPLARWSAAGPVPLPAPEALTEAFLWEEHRRVTKTATVSLHGNSYEVDPALVGRKVELVFDPFDLTRIEVRLAGAPMGLAIPHHIGRHSHPKAKPETPSDAAETQRHRLRTADRDRASGRTGARRQLRRPVRQHRPDPRSARPAHRRGGPTLMMDNLISYFGFSRTPFGRDLAPACCTATARTTKPSPASAGVSPNAASA